MFRILTGVSLHNIVRVIVVGQRCKGVMVKGFEHQCHFEHSPTGRVDRRLLAKVHPGCGHQLLSFDDYASSYVIRGWCRSVLSRCCLSYMMHTRVATSNSSGGIRLHDPGNPLRIDVLAHCLRRRARILLRGGTMVLVRERAVSESAGCSAGASNVEGCLTGASDNAGQGGICRCVVRVMRVKK